MDILEYAVDQGHDAPTAWGSDEGEESWETCAALFLREVF